MRFTIQKGTEKGPYREKNEDSIGVLQKPETIDGIDGIFAVADGLGGHERGEVASDMAISMFLRSLSIENQNRKPTLKNLPGFLDSTISNISQSICDIGFTGESMHRDPFTAGMATTLTVAVLSNQQIYIGHVGDSRAYLIRDENISQLTEDHTLVEDRIKQGLISRDRAKSFDRNIITQALGLDKPIIPYTNSYEISIGDYILICSDGLYGFLDDIEIMDMIKNPIQDDIAGALIEAALASGSNDNISVILVSF